ncbi:MAG TPA: hypothetical protein VGQ91_01475, partial [Ideonella sp.]|nr:hypothetical protein [Ideonella sp.]
MTKRTRFARSQIVTLAEWSPEVYSQPIDAAYRRVERAKELIMWARLKQRFADAHPAVRTVALVLAVAVTLGAVGGLKHLADKQYDDSLVTQDLSPPADVVLMSETKPAPPA